MNTTEQSNHEAATAPRPPAIAGVFIAVLRFCLPIVVLGGAVWAALALVGSRPAPVLAKFEPRATLVETMQPEVGNDRAVISGFGTVEAHRRLNLQPQVGGEVRSLNPALVPGGLVSLDDVLLQVDPRDYELEVEQRMTDVTTAEVALQMAEANGLVAEREWKLLGEEIETTELGEQLARKEPQRLEAKAKLNAALGRLQMANLDLERTTLSAPFNALVIEDSVEVGQVVAPGSRIGTLVGTDQFEVIASVPIAKLDWITIDPEQPERNSTARVSLELGEGRRLERTARVSRLAGEVERSGRLAKVILLIDDPLNRDEEPGRTPLLLGSYVRIEIEGPEITDVIELPRSIIHEDDTIWVMTNDDTLSIRKLDVIVGRIDSVLARVELAPGEEIVTSPLGVALPGMPLERLGGDDAASGTKVADS